MRVISDEEKKRIIELYMAECTIQQITHETGRCRQAIRKILKNAGCLDESRTEVYKAEDLAWLKKNWKWVIPENDRSKAGKYRKVYPGDRGIRTPYRPDGKFQ